MHVLLISGSTRPGSSNTRVLHKLHELDRPDITTELYTELVDLPAFVPGSDAPPAVTDLLSRMEDADAVVFSTPEYAGGLPGVLKNLLDWTVGGGQLYQKPVAWIDVANPGRGGGARDQLRTVLGYVGARIVDAACVHVSLGPEEATMPITTAEKDQLATAQSALATSTREVTDVDEL